MKTKISLLFFSISILVCFWAVKGYSQCALTYCSENGATFPLKGTARVLLVFAEITDPQNCLGTYGINVTGSNPLWPSGQLPIDKDDYLNPNSPSELGGKITDFLYEASFGQYILLGDYYPNLVQVSCSDIISASNIIGPTKLWAAVAEYLNNNPDPITGNPNTITTAHGLDLDQYFDNWNQPGTGLPKTFSATGNGKIDFVAVIWRNAVAYNSNCTLNARFFAGAGGTIKTLNGADNYSQNTSCNSDGWWVPFMVEWIHATYGGNNFHGTGGGSGARTFIPDYGKWFSVLGQGAYTIMRMYNAWDRARSGWKNPLKNFLISALDDIGTTEVPTSFDISNQNSTASGIYILRNFSSSGDAIRIKLPYFNTSPPYTSVYNQYLWLENHQMTSPFDHDLFTDACTQQLRPGLYSYITVGKDVKTGTQPQVFDNLPMNLEGWFYPLSAEGNYDFYWDYANTVPGNPAQACNWGNPNIPVDKSKSQINPFTGHNDLYQFLDFDKNGLWPTGDNIGTGLSEIIGGNVVENWPSSGDDEDAFNSAFSNNLKISLSSNPTPVPVYTHKFSGTPVPQNQILPSENRMIWLNGLSIEILDEDAFNDGSNALKVKIEWENYNIDKNVRWCGDIMLPDFPPAGYGSGNPDYLNVLTGQTVLLDQGLSATRTATPITYNGQPLLNDPTLFTCLPGSHFHLEDNSTVIVDNGSTLKLQNGSLLEIHNGATVIVKNGGKLLLESGSLLALHDGGKVFIDQGGILEYDNGSILLNGNNALLEIKGALFLKSNTTFTFNGSGYVKFSAPGFPSGNIMAGTNSKMLFTGSGKTNKVLEIIQESLYPPANITEFTIQNGKVELGNNSRINPMGLNTQITLNNILLTSTVGYYNGHRGIHLYGQPNVQINNCTFENGTYGIFAFLTYGGTPLTINGSTFQNCHYGLFSTDKGVTLNSCAFSNNALADWEAQSMTFPCRMNSVIANQNEVGVSFKPAGGNLTEFFITFTLLNSKSI